MLQKRRLPSAAEWQMMSPSLPFNDSAQGNELGSRSAPTQRRWMSN